MAYFVFDLDETLAEVYTLHYFLLTLRVKSDNPDISAKLTEAYDTFVAKVLEAEQSQFPLGILRPGILGVMKELDALKREEKLKKVIIYSNNGNLENLEFIRDLIALSLSQPKDELITDLIHWNYPGRKAEYTQPQRPGAANKTWPVLKGIIDEKYFPNSGESDFKPESVYFFDDYIGQRHWNGTVRGHLIQADLGLNYNMVTPYSFKASAERIGHIYTDVLKSFDGSTFSNFLVLNKTILGFKNINSIFTRPRTIIEQIDYIVKHIITYTKGTDNGIDTMMAAIEKVRSASSAAASPLAAANGSSGGKRITRRRRPRNSKTQAKKKLKWRP